MSKGNVMHGIAKHVFTLILDLSAWRHCTVVSVNCECVLYDCRLYSKIGRYK